MHLAARTAEALLGLYFIVSAVMKAFTVNRFAVQIAAYQVLPDKDLLQPVAVAVIAVEAFLGCLLLLGYARRWLSLGGAIAMLVLFSGLVLYGWLVHDLEDCGCLGAIAISPEATLLKNLVLLALAIGAWARLWSEKEVKKNGLRLGAAVLVAVAALAITYPNIEQTKIATPVPASDGEEEAAAPAGNFAGFAFDADGQQYDLNDGTYLVAMLSMDCEHCKASVPTLNNLYLMPELPPLVGLAYEEAPGQQEEFEAQTQPLFPLHNLGDRPLFFFKLIGNAPPRLSLVRDGVELQHWDDPIPGPEIVAEAVARLEEAPET